MYFILNMQFICTLCILCILYTILFYANYVKYSLYAHIYLFTFARIEKEGAIKEIFMFFSAFLRLFDKLFWNLPFTSAKQAEEVLGKFEILDNVWDAKWKQISSEHDQDSASDQL